jgi:hypothetical protein
MQTYLRVGTNSQGRSNAAGDDEGVGDELLKHGREDRNLRADNLTDKSVQSEEQEERDWGD